MKRLVIQSLVPPEAMFAVRDPHAMSRPNTFWMQRCMLWMQRCMMSDFDEKPFNPSFLNVFFSLSHEKTFMNMLASSQSLMMMRMGLKTRQLLILLLNPFLSSLPESLEVEDLPTCGWNSIKKLVLA